MEEVVNDPDRVLKPLRRTRGGGFEEVSWEAALSDIADRLSDVLDEHGKESVAWYMGNPGAFSYSHTLWAKGFLDAIGSPHYYSAGSQDVNNRFAASALLYGSPLVVPIPDLRRTDFLLMVGANPLVSHGSVLSAPRVREQLLGLEKRGGRVVVVDPRRSETAKQFEHLPDSPRRRRLASAVAAAGDLRRGAGRPRVAGRARRGLSGAGAPRGLALARGDRGAHRRSGRARPRPGACLRRRSQRRRLRAHRLVPRALRHPGVVPARRAQRRHREPGLAGRRGVRAPADRPGRRGRAGRPGLLRQDTGPLRRLPRRDRQPARVAVAAGDRDARGAADQGDVRVGR